MRRQSAATDWQNNPRVLKKLRAAGLRATRQRMALGDLLLDAGPRHVSAEGLHREAGAAGADVSVATVYNTLHQFTEAGLLREVVVQSGRVYYDTNISEHHHFYYPAEERLEDIPAHQVSFAGLPSPPRAQSIRRVDVIIHVEEGGD
jgi:Fur family iron response transcriptional regulator